MKTRKGFFVVWNETTFGSIFYGVCTSLKDAERLFNEICDKEGFNPYQAWKEDGNGNAESLRIDPLPLVQYK